MTVVDVTGRVLGGCCQVMLMLVLVFKFPPIAEVTHFRKKYAQGLPEMRCRRNVLCTIVTREIIN